MATLIIDEPTPNANDKIEFAPFIKRLIAILIDTIILFVIVLPLEYYNISIFKNTEFLIVISIFVVIYKPFFEYKFGATPGKKLTGIKVLSHEYHKLKLSRAAFRNTFFVIPSFLSTLITILIYNQPETLSVNSFIDYLTVLAKSKSLSYINITVIFINLLDSISILIDKKNRSVHDFIAGTIVVNS